MNIQLAPYCEDVSSETHEEGNFYVGTDQQISYIDIQIIELLILLVTGFQLDPKNVKKVFVDSVNYEQSIIWEADFSDNNVINRPAYFSAFVFKNSLYVLNYRLDIYNLSNRG